VRQVYNDHYFHGGEAGYPDYLSERDILISHGRRYARLLKNYTTAGTVLDVGAAAGFVLKGFEESGWSGIGIEPNPRMAEFGRTQLGIQVEAGTIEQFQTSETYDLISMIQVIAHFVDPRKAFEVAAEITKPAGLWLIETWNRESFVARVLGQHWHEYSPPSVLHWFSPEGLRCLAKQFGFSEVACGRPSKRLNAAHAKSLLHYKLQDSRLAVIASRPLDLIPDHLSIPYPNYDLFWALFQRS
jgi:SAM-dependent methyltransferase